MPHSSETTWDQKRLLRDRLAKIQSEMAKRSIGALVLTNPVAIRYATGMSVMPIWTALNIARYAIVPVSGEPVLGEYGKALFRALPLWPRSRPAIAWQSRFGQHEAERFARQWATELTGLLAEWGVQGEKVAIDTLDFHGFKALTDAGLTLADADEVMDYAKRIKTSDEITLLRQSCAVAEAALDRLEKAIEPGVTENELFAVFNGEMLARGGEYCSTRLLVCGEKTNPWFQEAGENPTRPGDLIAIDTDMTGPEGYLCDISRTFLCGSKATATQKEAYGVAYDFIHEMIPLCRPGVSYAELRRNAPPIPDEYKAQGYSCMLHGSGFDDEPPFVPFAHDEKAIVPRGELAASMVLSVEFYAGVRGRRDGVKLEEQILITENGPELLSRYPFEDRLL